MDNATITGSFTITPALTDDERDEMSFAHLDLVQHQEHTTITVDGHQIIADPEISDEARELLNDLNPGV